MRPSVIGAVAGIALCATSQVSAQTDPGRDAFIAWARGAAVPLRSTTPTSNDADLAPLRRMIGNATVVSISEGVHAGAEPLEFRNRLFRYLVEQMGFTTIAIESGITEGRTIHEWARGGPGDLATALRDGITWTFDRLPQNAELVQWIRDYNADPRHARKINIYGFDVPGSPGNPMGNRKMRTALDDALRFLATVDTAAAGRYHARLDSLLPFVHLDPRTSDSPQYPLLDQAQRDALTAAITDLISLFERREARYTAAGGANDYQWAYRNLLGARAADLWLRQIPVGWKPSSAEGMAFFSEATDVRDRFQADNVSWILDREGPGAKVVVFASRYHLSTTPVKTAFSRNSGGNAVAGTYLEPRLGDRLVTIGNLIGKGSFGCAGFSAPVNEAPPESIDRVAGEVGKPLYLLDLRSAPAPVKRWLDREHILGEGQGRFDLHLSRAFDVFLYMATVRPACPN